MTIFSQIAAAITALLLGSATLTGYSSAPKAGNGDPITWFADAQRQAGRDLTIEFRGHASSIALPIDELGGDTAHLRAVLASPAGGAFTLVREPGRLTCLKSASSGHAGQGTCTFAPNKRFVADLAARKISGATDATLLSMALLTVDRPLLDGLTRQGLAPHTADDILTLAALRVTPRYVAELQAAGLAMRSIEDAIVCRALDIDAGYVRAVVAAGYGDTAKRLITAKVTAVPSGYARRMKIVAPS